MSTASARAYNRKSAPSADNMAESSADTASVTAPKKTFWQKVKSATKKVVDTVIDTASKPVLAVRRAFRRIPLPGFARTAGRAVKAAAEHVAWRTNDVVESVLFYSKRAAFVVGRFFKKNWAYMLAGVLWVMALIVAPIPTLYATALIGSAFVLLGSASVAVVLVGQVMLELGLRIFVDGVVEGVRTSR